MREPSGRFVRVKFQFEVFVVVAPANLDQQTWVQSTCGQQRSDVVELQVQLNK